MYLSWTGDVPIRAYDDGTAADGRLARCDGMLTS